MTALVQDLNVAPPALIHQARAAMNSIVNSFRREACRLAASPRGTRLSPVVPLLSVLVLWVDPSRPVVAPPAVGGDEDHSSLSRELVRMLDATPGVQITQHYANATEAEREAARRGGSLCRGRGPARLCAL